MVRGASAAEEDGRTMSTTTIVSRTELCGAKHPTEEVTCGRPISHIGAHLSFDHSRSWGGEGAAAEKAPVCGLRHPMGKTCGQPVGHRGAHQSTDYLLSWNTWQPGQ